MTRKTEPGSITDLIERITKIAHLLLLDRICVAWCRSLLIHGI